MTLEQQKINLIAKINRLADRIDDRFGSMKVSQIERLSRELASLEDLICTRSGSDRRSR